MVARDEHSAGVHEIEPTVDIESTLPGSQFADAYRVNVGEIVRDARDAAERMVERNPRWIDVLMILRNIAVMPFGLETNPAKIADTTRKIGFFPVVNETPERIVLGFDDKHLDFRVVVDLRGFDGHCRVTGTTLVRTHNLLGRTYLAIVLPFHRVIVKSMLKRLTPSV